MAKLSFVVDVQGFKAAGNEFIFKEVALVPLEENTRPLVFLFEPPFPWDLLSLKNQSENCWLERNFHGLRWESGIVPYYAVGGVLNSIIKDGNVYVKGLEKKNWLKRYLPCSSIFNIEDLGCKALEKLPPNNSACINHRAPYLNVMCAQKNVEALKKWMMETNNHKDDKFCICM